MRVLFDQATPVPIREFLIGHTVRTVAQEHWDTLKNGDLLTAAEHAGFEVFLTTDMNLQYHRTWPVGPLPSSSSASSSGQRFNRTFPGSWPQSTAPSLAALPWWNFRSTDGQRRAKTAACTSAPQREVTPSV